MVTPPPPSTDPGIVFPICPGSAGGGEEHHSEIPRVSKNPKLQKNPTQVSDFWKLEEFAQNPKKPQNSSSFQNPKIQKSQPKFRIFGNSRNLLKIQKTQNSSSFQKSKNPNPSFGFLETRGICFQNSKNPKIPKIQKNPKFLEFPKIQIFLEFPKFQKSKNPNPSFGFLETRGICSKSKKTQNSSEFAQNPKKPKILGFFSRNLQNPKKPARVSKIQTGVGIFGFLEFWKLEEFWVFLDFEQIPRVSKNPKLEEFWGFWGNFGNSRNFGFFGF